MLKVHVQPDTQNSSDGSIYSFLELRAILPSPLNIE